MRQEIGGSVVFVSTLFDIDVLLKGYVGGLGAIGV